MFDLTDPYPIEPVRVGGGVIRGQRATCGHKRSDWVSTKRLVSSAIGFLPHLRSFKLFLFLMFMEHLLYFLPFKLIPIESKGDSYIRRY